MILKICTYFSLLFRHFPERDMEDVYILKLKNLLPADAGKYKCVADNGLNKPATHSLVIKVTGKIQQTNTYSKSLSLWKVLLPIILTHSGQCSISIRPENFRKALVFRLFQRV